MQINNIQTYNNSNQNFKALRLKKDSGKYVSALPDKVLNQLDDIGRYIANTKYYHLDIGADNFYITHLNEEKLFLPITITNAGKVLIIKAKQGLSQITKKLKFETTTEVKALENSIKQSTTQLERTSKIVKLLDDYEKTISEKEEDLVITPTDSRETKIQKLMKKYKI